MNKYVKGFLTNYQYKILLYLIIPFFLSIIAFSFLNKYFLNKLESEVLNKYTDSLNSLAYNFTEELNEIYQTSIMLESSKYFYDIYFSNTPIPLQDNYKFSHMVIALKNFKLTKNYIDSINIINKINNKVIGSNGTVTFDYFFNNSHFGEIYNTEEFWLNFSIDNNQMKILPIEIKDPGNIEIIPLAFFNIGSNISQNPLVVNLDKSKFSNFLYPYQLTKNSEIYVYNSTNNEIIASTSNISLTIDNIDDLIINSSETPLTMKINEKKYICINYSSIDLYNDHLEYIMLIPNTDIEYLPFQNKIIVFLFILICVLFSLLLCLTISSKIYAPIKELASLFPLEKNNTRNEDTITDMNILDNKIRTLISYNVDLKNDMTTIIPSVCEKYILNIIEQDDYDYNKLEPLLNKYNFSFAYNYFTTALIEFKFLDEFFKTFNVTEQQIIKEKLIPLMKSTERDKCKKFVLKLSKNKFCIILNSYEENLISYMESEILKLQELFNNDKSYLSIYCGIGQTYSGLHGIHNSWKESSQIFSTLSDFSKNKIDVYKSTNVIKTGYSLTTSEDNYIFNYLLSGNIDELILLIKNIISRNIESSISEASLKDLYLSFYSIGLKITNIKKITPSSLMNDDYIDILRYINTLSVNDLANYINKFFKSICIYNSSSNSSVEVDLKKLKKYIDNNYTKDIYLDSLSEQYNVTVKHMSKLLKKALGIPFKQYITNLRILKSKELLTDSDETIENIALKIGFNSRNTFIRAFKLLEGITPSEYRKNHK